MRKLLIKHIYYKISIHHRKNKFKTIYYNNIYKRYIKLKCNYSVIIVQTKSNTLNIN